VSAGGGAISLSKNQRTTPNRNDKQPARWTGHCLCPPGTMEKKSVRGNFPRSGCPVVTQYQDVHGLKRCLPETLDISYAKVSFVANDQSKA
jgi:hypothetical protein